MRLIEYQGNDDTVRFHTRVTILTGTDSSEREMLTATIDGMGVGADLPADGVALIHGIELTFQDAVTVLGPLFEPIGQKSLTDLVSKFGRTRHDRIADPGLRAFASAHIARLTLENALAARAASLAGAQTLRQKLADDLDRIRQESDEAAFERRDASDYELRRAAREQGQREPFTSSANRRERRLALKLKIDELDDELGGLVAGDRTQLAGAIAALRATLTNEAVPAPANAALAEAWRTLTRRLEGIESRHRAVNGDLAELDDEIIAAQRAVDGYEQITVNRTASAAQVEAIERLHDRVEELERKSGRGMRKGTARKEFEAASQELDNMINELGYDTWMSYRMGNRLATIDPGLLNKLENAIAAVENARSERYDHLEGRKNDEELVEVEAALSQVLEQAADRLEVEIKELANQDVGQLLESAVVPAATLGLDRDDALAHLGDVLSQQQLSSHLAVSSAEAALAIATTWLDALRAADDVAVQILCDRDRATNELSILERVGEEADEDPLADPRAHAQAAEEAADAQTLRLCRYAEVLTMTHQLTAHVVALAEDHDAKLVLVETATTIEQQLHNRLGPDVQVPEGVVPRPLPHSAAGCVPLLVVADEVSIADLEIAEQLTDETQIIVVTDDPAALAWAETVGIDRVGVFACGARSASMEKVAG